MLFEIKSRFTGSVIFSLETSSFNLCVEAAVKSGVSLSGSDLRGSNLSYSNLSGSNLSGSYLSGSNLSYSNLSYSKNSELVVAQTRILPEGSLIGWKKCSDGVIVKLCIPAEAKRSHAFGRKCRAEFADVLEVFNGDVGISQYDGKTEYRVGARVVPDAWSEDWKDECASGIHFFVTREEAEAY